MRVESLKHAPMKTCLQRLIQRYLWLILLFLAQSSSLLARQYTFQNITTTNGLSGLLVNVIYGDSDGFVWLGTDNGVDCFDGIRIRNYAFEGMGQSVKKRVEAIAMTADRSLYAGNGAGLWRLDHEQLKRVYANQIKTQVNALVAEGNTLYVGTNQGLAIVSKAAVNWIQLSADRWATANIVNALYKDGNDLWIATEGGLRKVDLNNGQVSAWNQTGSSANNEFKSIVKLGRTIYIGTSTQGLLLFDTTTKQFSAGPQLGCNVISALSTDGDDVVYVATDGNGVHFVSNSSKQVIASFTHQPDNANGISSNSVYSLMVDQRHMLWVGTYRNGFDYTLYHNDIFHVYAFPPLFTTSNLTVNQFSIRGEEKVIGTREGLYYINEKQGRMVHFTVPRLPANLILSVAYYQGKYYIGTYGGGLIALDPATLTVSTVVPQLTSGHVFCLRSDGNKALWIGSSQGLWCYSTLTHETHYYNSTNSRLPEGNVYDITFDEMGKGWIGTDNGLALYDPTQKVIRTGVFPKGFPDKDKIRRIFEDSHHNIYIIREKGNLFMTNAAMDKFSEVQLPILNAGNENSILSIVEDNRQNLWLGCTSGLFCRGSGGEYDLFGYNDGLPSQTFSNSSAERDADGVLWFGNAKGLVFVDPNDAELTYRKHRKPVRISAIRVNGTITADISALSYDENNLQFLFSDLMFGSPSSSLYEYKLDGIDTNWRLSTAKAEATYYHLSPGSYVFHVRIPGNSSTETTVAFTIKPLIPWWGWLLIALGGAAIVGIAVVHWKRKRLIAQTTEAINPQNEKAEITQSDKAEPQRELLSAKECEDLKRRLRAYMKEKRPYINKNLKSADVADALGTSVHALSYLLNKHMNVSFSDFVNEYRVADFCRMAASDRYSQYTLTALSEKCGFGSQASFFRSFKKIEGVTPNEYLRKLRSEKQE